MNHRNERVVVVYGRDTTNITAMVIGIIAVVVLILIFVLALGGESEDSDDEGVTVPTTITQDY
jgi:hypothetical protein